MNYFLLSNNSGCTLNCSNDDPGTVSDPTTFKCVFSCNTSNIHCEICLNFTACSQCYINFYLSQDLS